MLTTGQATAVLSATALCKAAQGRAQGHRQHLANAKQALRGFRCGGNTLPSTSASLHGFGRTCQVPDRDVPQGAHGVSFDSCLRYASG